MRASPWGNPTALPQFYKVFWGVDEKIIAGEWLTDSAPRKTHELLCTEYTLQTEPVLIE
jgi:hypothetical protein